LLETITVLRQKKQEELLQEFTKLVIEKDKYLPADTLGVEVAIAYSGSVFKKLSFVDVSLVLLSKKYTVLTLDKELQKML
jgi:predicted nucleic acid-binding protein